MKRAVALLSALMIVLATAKPAPASQPFIQVKTSGIELCPQFICGSAIFTGVLFGRVGFNPFALGTFTVAVKHDDLPDPGFDADIRGGGFELKVGLRRYSGIVLPFGGTLHANANNTFNVHALLWIQDGGSGLMIYDGVLDHNVFPPTIKGDITQP